MFKNDSRLFWAKSGFFVFALYAAGALYFLLSRFDSLWSGNADLAHHVVLISRLMDRFVVSASDPTLGEMAIYPRHAHIIAAVIGRLFESPVVGVQITTLLALLGGWTALFFAGRALPPVVRLSQGVILFVLLLLNDRFFKIEVFGQEVVANFFFSQLVAQALAFGALCVCIELEVRRAPRWARYLFLAAVVQLLARVHLLPAIEMLGFLAIVVAYDFCTTSDRVRQAVEGSLVWIVAAGLLVSSSVFREMMAISENDGYLNLKYFPGPSEAFVGALIAALIFVVIIALVFGGGERTRTEAVYPRTIATFGLSVAGLCILQFIALKYGQGSAYAVKKYAFGLQTVLLILLSIGMAFAARLFFRVNNRSGLVAGGLVVCLCPLFLIGAPSFGKANKVISVARLAGAERFARKYYDVLTEKSASKRDIAIDIAGVPNAGNYLISIGSLHHPRDENVASILNGRPPIHPEQIRYVVTSSESSFGSVSGCRRGVSAGDLVVIEMACVLDPAHLECGNWDLSKSGSVPPYILSGFYPSEPGGRWSEGRKASITCNVSAAFQKNPTKLNISIGALAPGEIQRMGVDIEGVRVLSVSLDREHAVRGASIPIPASALVDGKLRIDFNFPDAISPYELGLSGDRRTLAVMFRSLTFE